MYCSPINISFRHLLLDTARDKDTVPNQCAALSSMESGERAEDDL